jgi:hypothetical protein
MAAPAAGVDFDRNRLTQGELIAGVSALALFIFMFFDWYGAKVNAGPLGTFGGGLEGPNAWQSFSIIDLLLFLCILVAVGVASLRGLNRMPEMPYPPATLIAIAGVIAFLLVLFRFIVQPFDVPDQVDITRRLGIWLSLVASAAMAYGGWRAMQEAGTSFGDLTAGRPGGGAGATAPTTPMPASDPGVPGGGAAGVGEGKTGPGAPNPGTSTGGPDDKGGGPPPAASAGDPVPGQTGAQTPPGLAGEPPAGGGTQPPGL